MFDIQIMMDDMSFLIKKASKKYSILTKYESHQNDETFAYQNEN